MRLSKRTLLIGLGIMAGIAMIGSVVFFFVQWQENRNKESSQHQIIAISQASGRLLSITNFPALNQTLDEYGFWNYAWDEKGVKAKTLKVVYTDIPQHRWQMTDPDSGLVIASYSYGFENGMLTISVYVNPYDPSTKSDEAKSWYVEYYLLRLIHERILGGVPDEQAFYDKFYEEKPYFFKVKSFVAD